MRYLLVFIIKYSNWFLFVLLEILSMIMLFSYNSYQGSVWFSSSNYVVGKLYELESNIGHYFSMKNVNESLTQRNFYLERQVNQLSRLYADATGDTTALQRSELEILGRYELIPAKVVSNSLTSGNNLITINRGSADGVKVDMGVACGNGIVGVVYLVSSHYSVVMPLLNVKSRISCTIRHRGYFGYTNWIPGDPSIVYVEDIPRHARFKRGDWVETSGYSSIFPPGVLIGKIIEVYNSRDGLSYRLKVHLTTDFGNLRDVCVISDKEIGERIRLMQAARDSLKIEERK